MKTVAAGDEVARDFLLRAVGAEGDARPVSENIAQGDILGGVDRRRADRGAAVHEILGDLGLAVDHHRLAGHFLERNAVADAVDANLDAVVHQAVAVHAAADARLVEQVHRDLFDHAGADAAEHVLAGLALENDVVDTVLMKELAEQQSRRARPDNGDLGAHATTL